MHIYQSARKQAAPARSHRASELSLSPYIYIYIYVYIYKAINQQGNTRPQPVATAPPIPSRAAAVRRAASLVRSPESGRGEGVGYIYVYYGYIYYGVKVLCSC